MKNAAWETTELPLEGGLKMLDPPRANTAEGLPAGYDNAPEWGAHQQRRLPTHW